MPLLKPGSSPLSFLRSRLSQRIVLSVFGSIIAIEALILIPSVIRRKDELLNNLAQESTASLNVATVDLREDEIVFPQQLLDKISRMEAIPMVVGGAIYDMQGTLIGSFGEAPTMAFEQFSTVPDSTHFDPQSNRYETAQQIPLVRVPHWVIINHNTSEVRKEIRAFIWRILGLVLIISAVVTLTTMIVLRSILIAPILALSKDLRKAAPAALSESKSQMQPFDSARYQSKNDEIGEVIATFQKMFEQISEAIAQRRQAEISLRESDNRFRTLVNQAAESMVVLDKNATITNVNQFVTNALGYKTEELVGQSLSFINPTFDLEEYHSSWKQLETGNHATLESCYRRKDGSSYPIEVRMSLIQIDGEPQILAWVRDISDRKKAEKDQARLAEIGELAAMIVHEVRNPFSTVYMALSTFKNMDLPPRGQMRLALAMEESERLKRLLNEILAYSKEQKVAGEPVEINLLSQELAEQLQETSAAAGRQIKLMAAPDKLVVRGDRDKLKQVFINLVTNACEAIPAEEVVTWIITAKNNQPIEITIHNGGDPIPADVLPKLTKPFVSTKSNGNGLGLAITKRIIEAHGGALSIESTAEQGTTVTVLLPR